MGWLDAAIIATFLAAAIRMATPLILSAIGEIFAERSGVLNLAVEGLMLMGAFMAYWGADQTKSAWFGLGTIFLHKKGVSGFGPWISYLAGAPPVSP